MSQRISINQPKSNCLKLKALHMDMDIDIDVGKHVANAAETGNKLAP